MGLFVGYDAPRIDFRPGSCRRGYCDDRQRCVFGLLFFARPAEYIVPQVAVVGCHQGYGLCGVHDAAASQCDDHVAPVLPCRCRSGHDGGFQGVRFDPVEHHAFDPCQPELFLRGGQIAVFPGRLAVRNCQQRLFPGHLLAVQVFQFVCPEKDAGRDPHVEIHFCFHGSIVFDVFLHCKTTSRGAFVLYTYYGYIYPDYWFGFIDNQTSNQGKYTPITDNITPITVSAARRVGRICKNTIFVTGKEKSHGRNPENRHCRPV